ncbi:MAG: alanine racemase [Treponema sp. CETP13]|nr:MAG: alanine racemase [Treponema sp. CETP13]
MNSTKAIIHKKNLERNIKNIKTLIHSHTKICIPVKANAYGHGAVEISKLLIKNDVDVLAVAKLSEAAELRAANIKAPILLLSLPLEEEIPEVIKLNVQPFVFTKDFITALNEEAIKQNIPVKVHLKIDTGMGRIGCQPEEAAGLAKYIFSQSHVILNGCCTHFAVSDSLNPDDIEFTKKQIKLFTFAINSIKEEGINPGICHCSATGGTLQYSEAQFDMIRPGLIAYGYFPDEKIEKKVKHYHPGFELYPIMELQSKITSIKTISAGESISYGRKWISDAKTRIATIPIGYGDGLKRCLSPGLKVLINGKQYPIVGRICMDQCMINIGTKDTINIGDTVIIFSDKKEGQTLNDQARLANTIPYEILTGIMPRVPRIYVD